MADKTFYINDSTKRRVTDAGIHDISSIYLAYKRNEDWLINVIDDSLTQVDLSTIATMTASISQDRNDFTDPLERYLNASIDHTSSNQGIFILTVTTLTSAFRLAVNNLPFKQLYLQLQGFDASGYEVFSVVIPIFGIAGHDMTGGDPAGQNEEDTCEDDTATSITLFDKTVYRKCNVDFTLDNGTNIIDYAYSVAYNGTDVTWSSRGGMEIKGSEISGVSISFELSSDDVVLVVTLASVGSDVQCVSKIQDKLVLST